MRLRKTAWDSAQKEYVECKLGIFKPDVNYTNTLDIYRELYGNEDIDLVKYHQLYWSKHEEAEFSSEYKYYLEGATDPKDVHYLLPLDYYIEEV